MLTAHASVFRCDAARCDEAVVVDLETRFPPQHVADALGLLPDGWYGLVPSTPAGTAPDVQVFCSPACLDAWTTALVVRAGWAAT